MTRSPARDRASRHLPGKPYPETAPLHVPLPPAPRTGTGLRRRTRQLGARLRSAHHLIHRLFEEKWPQHVLLSAVIVALHAKWLHSMMPSAQWGITAITELALFLTMVYHLRKDKDT